MGLVALGALYAGFAAARAVKAGSLQSAALWGALTGPAWAIAMAVLVILAGGLFHGDADDTSVFSVFLLGGALFGAAGGALAGERSAGRAGPRVLVFLIQPEDERLERPLGLGERLLRVGDQLLDLADLLLKALAPRTMPAANAT